MSLIHDDGQLAMASEARRVLEARVGVAGLLPLLEQSGQFHLPFWQTAREQGWCAMAVPEAHGGLGLGLVDQGLLALQIGRSLAGAPFLTGGWGVARALAKQAESEAATRWLPHLASGEAAGSVAFACGQDPLPRRAALSLKDGRLNGTAQAVSGGGPADALP
ncbi:MAG TPA: acyl-CoA dehydrogenase family protein, partial [Novosphingobium sp.]|nr:acyl-CoA dehydrogenase family protein [Novosphingobium sp.]